MYTHNEGIDWVYWLGMCFWAGVLILATDALGWFAWAMSGQMPVDGWYFGTITGHLIQWLIHIF